MKWQPIETIPRDGTPVLAIRKSGRIGHGIWYNNPFGDTDTIIDEWSGRWWRATHWMPLPEPPEKQP